MHKEPIRALPLAIMKFIYIYVRFRTSSIHAQAYVIVFALRRCYGEVYGTLHVEKMADLVAVSL